MNPITKVAFSFAFCFCLVGGTLIFSGTSICNTAQDMDADFESTTFQRFLAGDVENRHLFEISKFRVGEQYFAIEDPRNGPLRVAYVPLYREDQPEDRGAGIGAIALVSRVDEQQLLPSLDLPSLQVQISDSIPPHAYDLGEAYPEINWANIKVVHVDSTIPTTSSGLSYLFVGLGLFVLGLVAAFFGCLLKWRTFKAKAEGTSYNEKVEELEQHAAPVNREVTDSKSTERLNKVAGFCLTAVPYVIFFNVLVVVLMRMQLVNDQVGFGILSFTGPSFLLLAVGGLGLRFFIPPVFKIQRVEVEAVPRKAQQKMILDIETFMQSGYEMLGFAKTEFMGEKWNSYLIAPDRRSLVEVTCEAGKVSCSLVAVVDHGLMLVIARSENELKIDGTEMGVPLIGEMSKKSSQLDLISKFEEFRSLLNKEGSQLLRIDPKNVFHVMHYESILSGWWAYKSSLRFAKPDSLPTVEEVVKSIDGLEEFGFQRWEGFNDAFDEPLISGRHNSDSFSGLQTAALLNSRA